MEEEHIRLEKQTQAIIDYYKLVFIENLTKDKSYSAFTMLGGKKLYKSIIENNDNGYISLYDKNLDLMSKLVFNLKNLFIGSMSNTYNIEFSNLDWITEIDNINPDDRLIDTIIKNASDNVYQELISTSRSSMRQRLTINEMQANIDSIKSISKKYNERLINR